MEPWSALAGVIIGGAISWASAYFVEGHRWRLSRRDKLDDARRQAIEAAFEWIDPMYVALMQAESNAFMLLNPGDEDQKEDRFRQTYPNLLRELKGLDLPPHQRLKLLLPPGSYQAGQRVVQGVENLKYQSLELWEKTVYPLHKPTLSRSDARLKCAETARAIRAEIDALKSSLDKAYESTY